MKMQSGFALLLVGLSFAVAFGCDRSRCCCPPDEGAVITVNVEKRNGKKGDMLRFDYAGFGQGCQREGDLQWFFCRHNADKNKCNEVGACPVLCTVIMDVATV